MNYPHKQPFHAWIAIGFTLLWIAETMATVSGPLSDDVQTVITDPVRIERLRPEGKGGVGYRLAYHVKVPVPVYWRFKTDFDNDFVTANKYIRYHRLVSRIGPVAMTENRYTYGPDVLFRWQTTVSKKMQRLDFVLLNPGECQQRYHHGYISIESENGGTRVTQVAYFDFWGASFWARYPWRGGMRDVLSYTARWEQAIAVQLADRYRNAEGTSEDGF